jgi:hypothetical protein
MVPTPLISHACPRTPSKGSKQKHIMGTLFLCDVQLFLPSRVFTLHLQGLCQYLQYYTKVRGKCVIYCTTAKIMNAEDLKHLCRER